MIAESTSLLQWLAELSQPLIAGGIIALTTAFFKLASHSSSLVELQKSMEKLHDSVEELSKAFAKYTAVVESTAEMVEHLHKEVDKLRDRQHDLSNQIMILKGKYEQH